MMKKKNKSSLLNMELKSDEAQALMGNIPSSILYIGIFLFLFFAVAILFLGYYATEKMDVDIMQFIKNKTKI